MTNKQKKVLQFKNYKKLDKNGDATSKMGQNAF